MVDSDITELTRPPDFEIRAENFIKQLKNLDYSPDDPGILSIENRTKMLARIFSSGMRFFKEKPDVSDGGIDDETKKLANGVLDAGRELESVLGSSLASAAEELDRRNDIDSATHNEVEVLIGDDSKKRVRDFIRKVDMVALQNCGLRDWGRPKIYRVVMEEESIDYYETVLNYFFT